MNLKEGLAFLKRNDFIRSVSILVGGTAFAHAITALALPFLSRLYSPNDFNLLAVFSSLLSIISVAACLRFEVAVPIPDDDSDAINILALALICAAIVSVLIAIPVLIVPGKLADRLNQPGLRPFLWLLPIGVLLAASYNALQSWFIREKQFGQIARTRIGQSAAGVGTQLCLGSAGVRPIGLLVGYVMNTGAACLVLGFRLLHNGRSVLRTIKWSHMQAMFLAYHRFPKYSALEAFSNSAANQLPIIIIAAKSVGPEAGYLILAMNVMQAPMALIGVAIGQVYLSRASGEHRAGRLGGFTANVFKGLLKAGVGPLLFIGVVSPAAFPIVFGDSWRRAGLLVAWMTPWFVMQFLASPISMALHVTGRQKTALMLQILGLAIRLAAVMSTALFAVNKISEAYAVSGFVVYLVYIIIVLRAVSIHWADVVRALLGSLLNLLIWIMVGIITAISIRLIF